MSFDALLGNDRLKLNLSQSIGAGHISHFYLISGPAGSGKHTLAKLLSAAILCQGRGKPCLTCGPCRRVMEARHPDVITVEDPEHKNVAVKIVRQMRDDMFIRPNESDYKIYLFPQELGIEGQNALLKILEEPPHYGVFILLTDNPEKLLPTVRSRCTELKMQALPENILRPYLRGRFPEAAEADVDAAIFRSGGFLGQAITLLESGGRLPQQTEDFLRAYGSRDDLLLTQTLVPMEKWKRDQLLEILQSWLEILVEAQACRSGVTAVSAPARQLARQRTGKDLAEGIRQLSKALDCARSNVSPAAICGYLQWHLR